MKTVIPVDRADGLEHEIPFHPQLTPPPPPPHIQNMSQFEGGRV